MPTEDELRAEFHEIRSGVDAQIDLDRVLRRARRRRAPRVAAVAIVSSLAVVGIVVPLSISVASGQTGTFSAGSAASAPDLSAGQVPEYATGGGGDSTIKRAPAERINFCTGTLAVPAPADDGLVLTVQPVDAAADSRDIPVTVTLTNTSAQRVTGSLSPFPTITLSRDGIVLWHSNGAVPSLGQEIDLAPGAATTFSTSFEPLVCGITDDTMPTFRAELPKAGAGSYQLSAALDFSPAVADASGRTAAVLVTGPTSPVTLH
jgi:hypothetical protein